MANKYYLLFQHHLAPPVSTFTTGRLSSDMPTYSAESSQDAPQTTSAEGASADPRQLENTFVLDEKTIDSSYIIGDRPGVSAVPDSKVVDSDIPVAIRNRAFPKYLFPAWRTDCVLRYRCSNRGKKLIPVLPC